MRLVPRSTPRCAAEMGSPFAPLRGIIGSDLLKLCPDWRVIENPFAAGDPMVLPAMRPDVSLFSSKEGGQRSLGSISRWSESGAATSSSGRRSAPMPSLSSTAAATSISAAPIR
jgi:hypothetical protein